MPHVHIYSFCGQPGCKDKPYHANTENLVSPEMEPHQIVEFFQDRLNMSDDPDPDTYVIRPCEGTCPNPEPLWLYLRQDNPLTQAIRPNHYSAAAHDEAGYWEHR